MKKYDLLRSGDSIIRVLDIRDERILVIDCIKHTMPVWVDVEPLKFGMLKCESLKRESFQSELFHPEMLGLECWSLKHRSFILNILAKKYLRVLMMSCLRLRDTQAMYRYL